MKQGKRQGNFQNNSERSSRLTPELKKLPVWIGAVKRTPAEWLQEENEIDRLLNR